MPAAADLCSAQPSADVEILKDVLEAVKCGMQVLEGVTA